MMVLVDAADAGERPGMLFATDAEERQAAVEHLDRSLP